MRAIIISLASLVSSSFFVQFSNAAITTMVALIVASNGGDQSDVAQIASAFSAGFIVGCFLSPPQIFRIGLIRAYAVAAAIMTIAIVTLNFSDSIFAWTLLRFLMGASFATVMAISDSWINTKAPSEQRGSIIAIYSTVLGLASICSQLFFLLLDATDEGFILIFAITMNLSVVLVAFGASSPANQHQTPPRYLRPLTVVSTPASVSAFMAGFSTASLVSILPFYLTDHGTDENLVALAIAALYSGRLICQWPIGRLSDKFDRRIMLAVLSAIVLFAFTAALYIGGYEGTTISGNRGQLLQMTTYGLIFIIGGTMWPMYSIASALAFDRADGRPMIDISTTMLVINSVGAIFGPLTILFTSSFLGDKSLVLCISTLCLVNIIVCLRGIMIREAPQDAVLSPAFIPDNSVEMVQAIADIAEQSQDPISKDSND